MLLCGGLSSPYREHIAKQSADCVCVAPLINKKQERRSGSERPITLARKQLERVHTQKTAFSERRVARGPDAYLYPVVACIGDDDVAPAVYGNARRLPQLPGLRPRRPNLRESCARVCVCAYVGVSVCADGCACRPIHHARRHTRHNRTQRPPQHQDRPTSQHFLRGNQKLPECFHGSVESPPTHIQAYSPPPPGSPSPPRKSERMVGQLIPAPADSHSVLVKLPSRCGYPCPPPPLSLSLPPPPPPLLPFPKEKTEEKRRTIIPGPGDSRPGQTPSRYGCLCPPPAPGLSHPARQPQGTSTLPPTSRSSQTPRVGSAPAA